MVVEYCRTVLGWEGAHSTENDESTPHPVVIFMPEVNKKGQTLPCALARAPDHRSFDAPPNLVVPARRVGLCHVIAMSRA